MDICNCNIDLDAFLCDIPHEWREGIVKALCYTFQEGEVTCAEIAKCESLTSLSPFTLNNGILSVKYTNENGHIKTATLDISAAIQDSLLEVDPKCLMSQEAWDDLTHEERLQSIIDATCICCEEPTTTTSTTSTTSTSTTSTTSTSTSSTTTTTTTANPESFIIYNDITLPNAANITDVESAIYYTVLTGSFPISNGNTVVATHTGFTSELFVVTLGPALAATGTAKITISKNGVQHECIDASSGIPLGGNVAYFFTIPLTAVISDLIEIRIISGVC